MLNNELNLTFNYEPITFSYIKDGIGRAVSNETEILLNNVKKGEKDLVSAWNRVHNPGKPEKRMRFNARIIWDKDICCTIHAHGMYRGDDKRSLSDGDYRNAQTFPQDYDFCGQKVAYICGMSVPPIMIKRIVTRLIESGVFKR